MRILAVVLAAGVALYMQSAMAAELAPYFWNWGGGAATSLMNAKSQVPGLKSATIAFIVSGGGCTDDHSTVAMASDIASFKASGGSVILSFGGASGTYLETACSTDTQLAALVESLMVRLGTRRLDFDVEGSQLSNTAATARRTSALKILQAKFPDIYLSFTLPVAPNGLPSSALDLVRSTAVAGVKIDRVNIMTMDYGAGTTGLGNVAISSAEGTRAQLQTVYPNYSAAQIYAMIGITPMIGKNDDGTIFSLSNANQVTTYAIQKGVGLLSYWAFQRDQAGTNINTSSGISQTKFAFYNAFAVAVGPPPPPPPPPPSCNFPNWVQGGLYVTGAVVKFTDGNYYIAEHDNPGYSPTISTWYWDPYICGSPPPPACNFPNWVQGQFYATGSIVKFTDGKYYIAEHDNPGYSPTISTWYWDPYSGC